MKFLSIRDVVKQSGIPKHKIVYAMERGFLKEPQMISGRRCFTEKELESIKEYFANKPKKEKNKEQLKMGR
jgi:DNA-binding transcriptional MerR regulator